MTIPTKAAIHIQNNAPGPPMAMALETPAMLPVPTVPPRAVAKAPKALINPPSFSSFFFFLKRVPIVLYTISPARLN